MEILLPLSLRGLQLEPVIVVHGLATEKDFDNTPLIFSQRLERSISRRLYQIMAIFMSNGALLGVV